MKEYRVDPKQKIKLADWDAEDDSVFSGSKKEAESQFIKLNSQLEILQEMLFAEHKHRVLVVLQAMDTGGKDGVIRHVFDGVNPQGVRVASFKVPTPVELDHDYLWRIHSQMPAMGEIVIFNRSHYEDVLVVRVHQFVPDEVWKQRYAQINDFEKMLSDEGTVIIKFYLHINRKEQKERMLERIDNPEKRWKFNPGDLKERLRWDEYMQAYEDVVTKTSTDWAPWYIIPANKKWYRNLMISRILVEKLQTLGMAYPQPSGDFEAYRKELLSD
jgi:PPK2 family polyphosphate:nucleotide phosphotransferase